MTSPESFDSKAPRPSHVPDFLVRDFDIFEVPGAQIDAHLAIRAVQQSAPDIFWTPRNGGHWVAARAAAIEEMLADHVRFTSSCVFVPKKPPEVQRELPIESDPPRHGPLRRPLVSALLPVAIKRHESKIRALAASLSADIAGRGECEFVGEVAQLFPIYIFLDLVGLPREDRHFLLPITKRVVGGRTPEERRDAVAALTDYILPIVRARRATPGDDLLSPLVNLIEADGARISERDAVSYASNVLFAGLDTVAAVLALITRFLALNPSHRRELAANLDDENFMRDAVEELLRRHGILAAGRVTAGDFEYRGISFRDGEPVILLTSMVGLDERRHEDPLRVDFRRGEMQTHALFGAGIHSCPGNVLARRELKIFLQEWLRRVPEFSLDPESAPVFTTGFVISLAELKLVWG